MDAETLAGTAGALLSLLFAYTPGLSGWYARLGAEADLDAAIGETLRLLSVVVSAGYTAALTLTADGYELSLAALSDLIGVTEVWFPYVAPAVGVGEVFGVCPFRFFWEGETPTLRLEPEGGRMPRAGESLGGGWEVDRRPVTGDGA
jgi:hypothetical protein